MRKLKRISMALLLTGVLLMAAGCSCNADGTVDDNGNNNNNNGTTGNGGLVNDIGDDIQNGIDDIGNDLDGNGNTNNR